MRTTPARPPPRPGRSTCTPHYRQDRIVFLMRKSALGTRLPLRQGHPRLNSRKGPHPRPGRPVGPPGHGRGRPAAARPPAGRRPAPPLGKGAPTPPGPYLPAGFGAGFLTSAPAWAPPPVSLNSPGPARAGPKAPPAARHPATQSRRKAAKRTNKKPKTALNRLNLSSEVGGEPDRAARARPGNPVSRRRSAGDDWAYRAAATEPEGQVAGIEWGFSPSRPG